MRSLTRLNVLTLGSLAVLLAAPLVGGQTIPIRAILFPGTDDPSATVFWCIRLPRVSSAAVAGSGLAAAGMAFQAMFRNALATPFTLGVSSGAALGAAIAVRLGLGAMFSGATGVSYCAVAGALLAILAVHGATRIKRDPTSGTMLLAGVALNFFFSSIILLLQYSTDLYGSLRMVRWSMGGLETVGFEAPVRMFPFVFAGCLLLATQVAELNLLCVGDDWAASRGVAVSRTRTILFLAVSCMVGVIVSTCGPIGFVGLVCPHVCRMLFGPEHRRLLPATLLFGAAFLVACDTASRTVFAPTEIPVGIITSLVGGPFFLWLLMRTGTPGGDLR